MSSTQQCQGGARDCLAQSTGQFPIRIRLYDPKDLEFVRTLFIAVNRHLAPPHLEAQFQAYVVRALRDEINRIPEYYGEHSGSFWIAETIAGRHVAMYGLEAADDTSLEIRRMYVDATFRRQGIARRLLAHAEQVGKAGGYSRLVLSTSELQQPAIALYRNAGFALAETRTVDSMSLKTVGGGLQRYYMEKSLY